jgi:hypothetical protein
MTDLLRRIVCSRFQSFWLAAGIFGCSAGGVSLEEQQTATSGGDGPQVSEVSEALQLLPNAPTPRGPWVHRARVEQPSANLAAGGLLYNPSPLTYGGGPVMSSTTKIYYIWYGNWSGNTGANAILTNLAQKLGGSPWWNINTSYYDTTNAHVRNLVQYGGSAVVGATAPYPQGSALTDASILTIVTNALSGPSPALPTDTNGIYLVLTSPDVTETTTAAATSAGFCKTGAAPTPGAAYCGWHFFGTVNSQTIKYGFIGNPSTQAACKVPGTACEFTAGTTFSTSPNANNKAADSMASFISHEVAEAATDPLINAWTGENADKCAWRWGPTYSATNGGTANIRLGTRDYLIQQNLINNGRGAGNGTGVCAMRLLRSNNLLWRDSLGNTVVWKLNNGTSVETFGNGYAVSNSWVISGTGDFDADDQGEILWRNSSTGDVVMWFMDSTVLSTGTTVTSALPLVWQTIGVGDFNNDGRDDILWRNTSNGDVVIWFMNGTTISSSSTVFGGWPLAWGGARVGDFNGDNKADILWRNSSTGDVRMWLMNGGVISSSTVISAGLASAWQTATAGTRDFNNDGKSDILWRNTSTGDVRLWLMNGTSITSNALVYTALDLLWTINGTGDFNGDGNSDIIFQHLDGSTSTWLMNGATISSSNALPNEFGWGILGTLSDQNN